MSTKVLITSGCSFTGWEGAKKTWAHYLSSNYGVFYNEGRGAQSNRLIKNRTYYRVNECISRGIKADDITVGIMWTGIDRTAFYNHKDDKLESTLYTKQIKHLRNFNFTSSKSFFWKPTVSVTSITPSDLNYYKYIYLESDHIARFLEDVIALQNFLTSKGIKYFMTTAWDLDSFRNDTWSCGYRDMLPVDIFNKNYIKKLGSEYNLDYIVDNIDLNRFLDIRGMWEYCYHINPNRDCKKDHHPTEDENKQFYNNIVKPFILS